MADQERALRVAGFRAADLPSLEQVERRRFELWLVSTIALVGLTASVAVLSLWSPSSLHHLLAEPIVRAGSVSLSVVVSGYLVEKEVSLRRVARLLFDERVLTTALTNRLREITALLDAGRAVNSVLELDQVLAAILRGATELLPAASGSIMLCEGSELHCVAAVGNEAALGSRQALGDGIAGHVAGTRQALLVNGPASTALFPRLVVRPREVDSALSVPLIERAELLGVLNVSARSGRPFTEYDLRAVSLFAEQASAAIAKSRLYEASRRQAEELAYRADHDSLTGLVNRAGLTSRVSVALRGDRVTRGGVALLFLDLDGFKAVNDELGHPTGDRLLLAVARRLRAALSEADVVARLGGDEFAVVLSGVRDSVTALAVADRLVGVVNAPFEVDGVTLKITTSIGVALSGAESTGFDELLRWADHALYEAKGSGRACSRLYRAGAVPERVIPVPRAASADPLCPPAGIASPAADPLVVATAAPATRAAAAELADPAELAGVVSAAEPPGYAGLPGCERSR